MSDETGWEFETERRIYANLGLDAAGKTTPFAWKIVKRSPESTALDAEETRLERIKFPIDPRDARRFTIRAALRYHYAPATDEGAGGGLTMTETTTTLSGRRPPRAQRESHG